MKSDFFILQEKWNKGNRSLKSLIIIFLFEEKEIEIEIFNKKQIKKLLKRNFSKLPMKKIRMLSMDIKREFILNKKNCKKAIKMKNKFEKIFIANKELLN